MFTIQKRYRFNVGAPEEGGGRAIDQKRSQKTNLILGGWLDGLNNNNNKSAKLGPGMAISPVATLCTHLDTGLPKTESR